MIIIEYMFHILFAIENIYKKIVRLSQQWFNLNIQPSKQPNPLKYKLIVPNNEIDKLLYEKCTFVLRKNFIEVGDEKFVFPESHLHIADEVENFKVRDSDVWVISYPKSGTTWTQEMVRLIVNNVNFEEANEAIWVRYTTLESDALYDIPFYSILRYVTKYTTKLKWLEGIASAFVLAESNPRQPRLFKTHLPWSLLPKALREGKTKAKIVYITRNPKDVCSSYYYFQRAIESFSGTYEDYYKLFLSGKIYYGPYWKSIFQFFQQKNNPNVCFIKYEDMKRDIVPVIVKVSDFLLGRQLSQEKILQLEQHLSFHNMKNNENVNYEDIMKIVSFLFRSSKGKFMRKGEIGGYKDDMTPEMEKKFDEWIEMNTQGLDLTF